MARDLRRRAGAVLLLAVLLTAATSCFQASVGLEVADDGSGQLVVDVYPSPQLLTVVGGDLPAFANQLQKAAAAQSPGAVVKVDDTPQGQALHIELPFSDVEAITTDAAAGGGGVTGSLLGGVVQRLTITHTGRKWAMDAVIDARATQGGLLGSPLAANPDLRILPTVFFSVTLPGRVDSTNAPTSKGGTATWTIRTTGDGPQTFKMVNSSVPVLPYVLSIVVPVLLLAALFVVFRRWRRRKVQAALHAEARAAAVASVAATPVASTWGAGASGGPAQGWYPDPAGSPKLRWWDGSAWTDHLHDPPG